MNNEQLKDFLPQDSPFTPFVLRTNLSSAARNIGVVPEEFTGNRHDFHEFLDWLTRNGVKYDSTVLEYVTLPHGERACVYCTSDIFKGGELGLEKINPSVLDSLTRKQFKNPVFQALQKQLLRRA